MTRPDNPSENTPDAGTPGGALADQLRMILQRFPDLVQDPTALARRLVPELISAGLVVSQAASGSAASASGDTVEMRVVKAITKHPAGRYPGLSPDALTALTGLSGPSLARAVSTLIQSGELVRDAWLVRLPEDGDLLPQSMSQERAERSEVRVAEDTERRAIGDRRSVGERRLYDRRLYQ